MKQHNMVDLYKLPILGIWGYTKESYVSVIFGKYI